MINRLKTWTIAPCLTWISLSCLLAVADAGDDLHLDKWPQLRGVQQQAVWHQPNTIDAFAKSGPKYRWRVKLGPGYAGAAIASGRVFVADRTKDAGKGKKVENGIRSAGQIPGGERVVCLDEASGKIIWQHVYDCPYKIAYPTGPRCTPTIDGERVYTLGAMGRLICLAASSGDIVWQKELTKEYATRPPIWGYSSPPLVDGNNLLVPVGGKGSGVVAFDKRTGAEVWKSITTSDIAYAPLTIYAAGSERQLIFWHADSVDSLDPQSGRRFWSVKFPNERNPSQTSINMPIVAGDRLLISEFYKGSLLLQIKSDPPAVKELWRSQTKDPRSKTTLNSLMTSPVVQDGYAYAVANDSRGKGIFRCIELESGKMKWTKADWQSPKPLVFATAFLVQNGDKYFLFNDLGELMIVRLSPDGFQELDRVKVLDTSGVARGREVVWCQPACANGHMILRNDQEIISIDLRK